MAAKLQEPITGPHLAPQSVDVEFSSHGLTPSDSDLFRGVRRRWTTSGLLVERAGEAKPAEVILGALRAPAGRAQVTESSRRWPARK